MRSRLYWLIVAVLLVGVMLLAVAWQNWTNPVQEVSDLYLRYADDPGVEASFVKGSRINDTLAIDATLLRAKDSAGWERLVEDFHLSKFIDSSAYNTPRSATIAKVLKKDPTIIRTSLNEPFSCRIALPYEKEIHVYDAETNEQSIALNKYFLLRMSNY